MKPRPARLQALTAIARLRADRALSDLAEACGACAALERDLDRMAAERRRHLGAAPAPGQGAALARWLRADAARRRDLLGKLARNRARRQVLEDAARQEEGRRQALDRLSGQAS